MTTFVELLQSSKSLLAGLRNRLVLDETATRANHEAAGHVRFAISSLCKAQAVMSDRELPLETRYRDLLYRVEQIRAEIFQVDCQLVDNQGWSEAMENRVLHDENQRMISEVGDLAGSLRGICNEYNWVD